MKILSIVGARPQFVKEASIQRAMSLYDGLEEVLIHTGQHFDYNMSGEFFDVFSMRSPDYNLGIANMSHSQMTAEMMIGIEKIAIKEKPDVFLLYGDTNSTLAGALVASKMQIPIAHVEAGLRRAKLDIPEEINRVLTDRVSTYLFVPSKVSEKNLISEGIKQGIYNVGDVMYDVFVQSRPFFRQNLIKSLDLEENKYIVSTLHRDFNVDVKENLEDILRELQKVSKEIKVVFPGHPRTMKRIKEFELTKYLEGIIILEPISYLDLMGLTSKCYKVITDSGGFQKEAYFAGKNSVVILPDTWWVELLDYGYNQLALRHDFLETAMRNPVEVIEDEIYGNGNASIQILEILCRQFNIK